jgi:hypothetical protein
MWPLTAVEVTNVRDAVGKDEDVALEPTVKQRRNSTADWMLARQWFMHGELEDKAPMLELGHLHGQQWRLEKSFPKL